MYPQGYLLIAYNLAMPGTQGSQSFLNSKQELMRDYRVAQGYSKKHQVQTYHGDVAEATFRRWLEKFLPQKYGVTSGYVISQGLTENDPMPHFDVIIYNRLEAPVLWTEASPDSADQGHVRAIPAEYVVAIFEVKSSFERKTVDKSLGKLKEFEQLLPVDTPNEEYKKYLPRNFCSALIFFELRKENKNYLDTLPSIYEQHPKRGFLGALILEGDGKDPDLTGWTHLISGNTAETQPSNSGDLLLSSTVFDGKNLGLDGQNLSYLLSWSKSHFAWFMHTLIAHWNGALKSGRLPSFHGLMWETE